MPSCPQRTIPGAWQARRASAGCTGDQGLHWGRLQEQRSCRPGALCPRQTQAPPYPTFHRTPRGPSWIIGLKRSPGSSARQPGDPCGQPAAAQCPCGDGQRAAHVGHLFPWHRAGVRGLRGHIRFSWREHHLLLSLELTAPSCLSTSGWASGPTLCSRPKLNPSSPPSGMLGAFPGGCEGRTRWPINNTHIPQACGAGRPC